MTSRGLSPADQSSTHDGIAGEHVTYRRGVRDDRYPALLPGVDKPTPPTTTTCSSGAVRSSFIGDDVEKLYDFTVAASGGGGTDAAAAACRAVDYVPAVERAASTVDVGGTLALFGASDRLYQSAAAVALACPLCVHAGSTWTREAVYVERRRRDHDADCPLHVDKTSSPDVGRWHDQQHGDVYPPGLRSPDQLATADNYQRHDLNVSRSQ